MSDFFQSPENSSDVSIDLPSRLRVVVIRVSLGALCKTH